MGAPVKIRTRVVSGAGRAAYFTGLAWVQAQCAEKLGFTPYPGTLNLSLASEDLGLLESALRRAGVDLIPPEPGFCAARVLPVLVGSVPGALLLPDGEARIHASDIVEVIAPVGLREALALEDGDEVPLHWEDPSRQGGNGNQAPAVLLRGDEPARPFRLQALIFDLDGTLIDTIPAYFGIVDVVARRLYLPPVPRAAVVEAVKDGRFEWTRILQDAPEGQREEYGERAMAIVKEIAPSLFREKIPLFPGVEPLLTSMARQGVTMGIATSTPRRFIGRKLVAIREAGLDGAFQAVVTADDVPRNKPAPDPLLACAGRLGVAARDCAYIGDMRVDIQAGQAAGMITVGVLTGFDDDPSLRSARPDLILASAAALAQRVTVEKRRT